MQLDWVTFGLEIINFLVLVWILQHFLYKPVLATIERRKAAVEKVLADAADRRKEADELKQQLQDRIAGWEKEKEGLRKEALAKVEDERKRRMAAMQADLERENEKRLAVERHQAEEQRRHVEHETIARAGRMASALLQRLASPELEDRLVTVLVEDLGQLDDERRRSLAEACQHADGKAAVTSAFPIAERARSKIVSALEQAVGRRVTAEFGKDEALVTGLRISVGPLVLHANIGDELTYFAEHLVDAN
jgi:F-type H+-transporting ATPase subunit b